MKNAINMARDAMELKCVALEDNDLDIPEPSKTLDVANGTFSQDGKMVLAYVNVCYDEKIFINDKQVFDKTS